VRVLSAEWVLPVEGAPIKNGAVAIEDGRIAAVGTIDDLGAGDHFAEAAIVPGIVNAHSHLEYAVYAGFGDGLSFAPWLATHIERKARIDLMQMESIARLGAAQCLASGITTVCNAAFRGASAHACAELGLRAIVYLEVFGREAAEAMQQFEEKTAYVASALSDRVRIGVSPHAPYTCSSEVYATCLSLGVPVMTHFNESQDELDWLVHGEGPMKPVEPLLIDPDGQSGIRRLAAAGLLDPRIVAAHCVKVDAEEIGLLARHDVAVVHCPRSNAFLGCGIAPLAELRAAGLRVGIGTDGVSSVPSHDAFEELRAVISAARARSERADALSPPEALALATLGGARALGLEAEIGSLVPGKRADLAILALSGSPYLPWEDPAAAIVYGGAPERVLATLVDGEARYERGGFEWHELIDAASAARSRMLALVPAGATPPAVTATSQP
jgi:cytosine/adenosine deaminase-related metal-dependent hydrolase